MHKLDCPWESRAHSYPVFTILSAQELQAHRNTMNGALEHDSRIRMGWKGSSDSGPQEHV